MPASERHRRCPSFRRGLPSVATQAGNSVGRYHDPRVVGIAFAEQYCRILNTSPEDSHKFYHDESIVGRPGFDGQMTSITTRRAIKEYFLSTELKGCSTELENVYAQPSHGDGVFVVITGSFTMPNTVKRRFTQSFFLAPQETGGYFVLNDVLSYIRAEPEIPSLKERMGTQQRFRQGDNEDNTVQNGSGDDSSGEMGDRQLCVICLKDRRNAAFVPCGHLVCCCSCAKRVELKDEPLCPVCRQDIQYVLRVYES
nr:uncharacterized protein LOC127312496 isoform X2 [Lolium perenne]